MSKNVIKQIQQQIQKQNQKLIATLKNDIVQTFQNKEKEFESYFSHKEKKIKKAYTGLISKLNGYKQKQNSDIEDLKNAIEKINCMFKKHSEKNRKLNTKISNVKNELEQELKKEVAENNQAMENTKKDLHNVKKKVNGKIESLNITDDHASISQLLSTLK